MSERGAYGPPAGLPDDEITFPMESARDIDNPALSRRFSNTFRFKTGRALQKVAAWCLPSVPIGTFNPEDFFPDDALGLASVRAVQTAVTSQAVAFYNPINSGLLVIVEEYQVQRLQTAGPIGMLVTPFDLRVVGGAGWTIVGTNHPRDVRLGFAGLGNLGIFAATNAALPASPTLTGYFIGGSGAGNLPAVSRKAIVLVPGSGLMWEPIDLTSPTLVAIVNEGISVVVAYRARLLDPSGSQHTPAGP